MCIAFGDKIHCRSCARKNLKIYGVLQVENFFISQSQKEVVSSVIKPFYVENVGANDHYALDIPVSLSTRHA
jgi:hypothetical protein